MRGVAWGMMMLLVACSGSGGAEPDGAVGDGLPPARPATVQQINAEQVLAGEWVELQGVVVTAVDGHDKYRGDVYVQQGSGPGSGLRLFQPPGGADGLAPGDRLDVVGQVKHYAPQGGFNDTMHPHKTYVRELVEARVSRLGAGNPPAPINVTVEQLVTDPTAAGWEHVLVRVQGATVVKGASAHGEFEVKGGLRVDDELFAHAPDVGDCLQIVGIGSYFYGYKLQPRTAADIQPATSCATQPTHTIRDLQDPTRPDHPQVGTWVTVRGVVTAVDRTLESQGTYEGFYIQEPAGGPHSGIYVYHKWSDASAQRPLAGHRVLLSGTYTEYGETSTLSELTGVSWVDEGQTLLPPPVDLPAAAIVPGGPTAELYEGVLVQVKGIQVGSYKIDSKGVKIGFVDANSGLLVIHKLFDFMSPPPAPGTYFSRVAGPLHDFGGTYEVMPRDAGDLVP